MTPRFCREASGFMKRSAPGLIVLACLFLAVSCRAPQKEPLARVAGRDCPAAYKDDLDLKGLKEAAELQRAYFKAAKERGGFESSHPDFTAERMKSSLELLLSYLGQNPDAGSLDRFIRSNFDAYRAAGGDGYGKLLFTGYYIPVLEGSREPTPEYRYPIYRSPDDLVRVDLGLFDSQWKGRQLRGRLEGSGLVPYYSRSEIDKGNAVGKDRGLAFLWVKDYMDLFFLHIQGSGQVRLPSGDLVNVNYDDKNGHSYTSIGRLLVEDGKISREDVSLQSIKRYFREHPDEMERYLFRNESYVFFREAPADRFPLGSLNFPLTAGRSVAADARVFPKGGLVFIESEKPVISEDGEIQRWEKFSRLCIDQDQGGAIKGPGRMDIFFGAGKYAEVAAGHFKQEGRAYYLLRKAGSRPEAK